MFSMVSDRICFLGPAVYANLGKRDLRWSVCWAGYSLCA